VIRDEAKRVRERLARADAATRGVEEAEALSRKKNELSGLTTKIRYLARRRSLLRQGGVPLSRPSDVESVKKPCVSVLTKFTESPTATTLVERQRWTKLTESLTKFITEEETLQTQGWESYCANRLFGGVRPAQREQTILMTLPENQRFFARYKSLYSKLSQLRGAVPGTLEELEEARDCSKQLSEIRFVENNDVPAAVREFFNATSSGGGAHLDLLTTEVLDWLRANGMLKNFAVRAI
jgi:hypothetical protein